MKMQKLLSDKERIEFAKGVEQLFEASHASWKKLLALSFLRGLATGFGVFIGGTIVVALLLWILSGLGNIPFLNDLTDSVEQTLDRGRTR